MDLDFIIFIFIFILILKVYPRWNIIPSLRYLSSSRQDLDTMGNFGQFDIAPPAYGQNVGEEEEE